MTRPEIAPSPNVNSPPGAFPSRAQPTSLWTHGPFFYVAQFRGASSGCEAAGGAGCFPWRFQCVAQL